MQIYPSARKLLSVNGQASSDSSHLQRLKCRPQGNALIHHGLITRNWIGPDNADPTGKGAPSAGNWKPDAGRPLRVIQADAPFVAFGAAVDCSLAAVILELVDWSDDRQAGFDDSSHIGNPCRLKKEDFE